MPAPKGNRFWELRSKHGRDKLFATPALLWEAACEYFIWCEKHPFYEVEQIKSPGRPYYDQFKDKMVSPPTIIKLPKMRPFTMEGLCSYLDCNTAYFRNFKANLPAGEEGFSTVITRVEETVYNQKFSGAASGFLNANIIARDLGLADKQDVSTTTITVEVKE